MKKKTIALIPGILALLILAATPALAAPNIIIPAPLDLPPGAMSYGNTNSGLPLDPNIIAALIGILGLIIGSIITIFASYFMRWMDVRREDKREDLLIERNKKDKEYEMKQDIYRNFLNELANMETLQMKDMDSFMKEWTRMEIKIDLVASSKVRQAKDVIQSEMMNVAETGLKNGTPKLSPEYMHNRDLLLKAIREDIDILQNEEA